MDVVYVFEVEMMLSISVTCFGRKLIGPRMPCFRKNFLKIDMIFSKKILHTSRSAM